jgi:hypothetical protein
MGARNSATAPPAGQTASLESDPNRRPRSSLGLGRTGIADPAQSAAGSRVGLLISA